MPLSDFDMLFAIALTRCTLYQDARNGIAGAGIEYYLPLFFENTETLFDYLPRGSLIVSEAGTIEAVEQFREELGQRHESRRHDLERPILTPDELYLTAGEFQDRLTEFPQVICSEEQSSGERFAVGQAPAVPLAEPEQATERLAKLTGDGQRMLITVDSPGRREVVADRLATMTERPVTVAHWDEFRNGDMPLAIVVAPLDDGFVLQDVALSIITERQLFGERHHSRVSERRVGRDPESIIRDLTDLHPGAPVVHEDYGVGRYLGLQHIDSGGVESEFLTLEYANGDKLYVPVASLDLISRYTGSSAETAPLHRLGSRQWEKARRKAAEKAHDVAVELLDIYARREARGGHSIRIDKSLYEEFADGFPFEETPDQATAIESVLNDLTLAQPMDRVVCGDVGFGKTEVALRAAFAVVHANKQLALLVPTTLLAQQHYQNFLDRFANWPVSIEVLSRFRSKKENDVALAKIRAGQIDIVIGTHRLLQKDVKFKNLGLLIIDEEQRFGVRQKERLKSLRAEVDVLTLTATPIPRTLNLAMSGLRDLSIIATAPAHRMAVKTYINQWDANVLRDTVHRELMRGGQVFFLHNEVQSIERMARELEELFPEARIQVAHGQMPERELEQVMLDFYRQRFNVLVCTTIIESGIDIPTANTIVINRADRFGLAQLHQLRGRVGRSHHRAYAYLIVPHPKAMSSDAVKRLEALESLAELGAGFTLATHDLEIRGAGELLGEGQSGQIQEVGFSLYTELLERAVRALKSGKQPELDAPLDHGCQVDLSLPALIPESYLPDVHSRLVLYKRIASARDNHQLEQLQIEMIDRFGLLPPPVKNLFEVSRVKLRAGLIGIRELHVNGDGGRVLFEDNPDLDPMNLIRLVQSRPDCFRFDGQQKIRFQFSLPEPGDRIRAADQLLTDLGAKNAS
jgi:transcription-repair coupling factor (superfamily II helicase)